MSLNYQGDDHVSRTTPKPKLAEKSAKPVPRANQAAREELICFTSKQVGTVETGQRSNGPQNEGREQRETVQAQATRSTMPQLKWGLVARHASDAPGRARDTGTRPVIAPLSSPDIEATARSGHGQPLEDLERKIEESAGQPLVDDEATAWGDEAAAGAQHRPEASPTIRPLIRRGWASSLGHSAQTDTPSLRDRNGAPGKVGDEVFLSSHPSVPRQLQSAFATIIGSREGRAQLQLCGRERGTVTRRMEKFLAEASTRGLASDAFSVDNELREYVRLRRKDHIAWSARRRAGSAAPYVERPLPPLPPLPPTLSPRVRVHVSKPPPAIAEPGPVFPSHVQSQRCAPEEVQVGCAAIIAATGGVPDELHGQLAQIVGLEDGRAQLQVLRALSKLDTSRVVNFQINLLHAGLPSHLYCAIPNHVATYILHLNKHDRRRRALRHMVASRSERHQLNAIFDCGANVFISSHRGV